MARTASTTSKPRATKTKPAEETAVAEETVTAVVETAVEDNEAEEVKEVKATKAKTVEKVETPLEDADEIEVIALIPNVSYLDSSTSDFYKWEEPGHVELMPFSTIKNMWRKHKGYFKNMWLKPEDDRVIKKLGLSGVYDKYEFLMDEENYTEENIGEILDDISGTPNAMKISIVNKIKSMVEDGDITNIRVIKTIDEKLDLNLIAFLD